MSKCMRGRDGKLTSNYMETLEPLRLLGLAYDATLTLELELREDVQARQLKEREEAQERDQ